LEALRKPAPPALAGAVLVSARYKGAVTGAVADVEADFQVYCPADRVTLKIPLDGVDLKEGTLLEGAFVYPEALPAPQAGYAVRITGRKDQLVRLTLPFRVRLTAAGDGADLSFT